MPEPTRAAPTPVAAPIGLAREIVLVAAGGMVGALARAAVVASTGSSLARFPLSTQLVNAVGAFALGLFLAGLELGRPRPHLRPFLAVGVLGAFTTFSTLVDDGRALATNGSPPHALAFLVLSIAVGLLAYQTGRGLGRVLFARRPRRDGAET